MERNYFAAFFGLALLMPGILPSPGTGPVAHGLQGEKGDSTGFNEADYNYVAAGNNPVQGEGMDALKASAILAGIGLATGIAGFAVVRRLD